MKIKIEIPLPKRFSIEMIEHVKSYYPEYEVEYSNDENIHFTKNDSNEDIFGIIVNIGNRFKLKVEQFLYDKMKLYQDRYPNFNFVFIPTQTEESKTIKLTNTLNEIELL